MKTDYEKNIPATMSDCYKALDQLLDTNQKEDIKKIENMDGLYVYHFSLGLWIRNNWIYPTDDRIARVFLDLGFFHPDDMSQEIIRGYYYYLNNIPYEIGQGG